MCSLDPLNYRVIIPKMSEKKATATSATKKAGAAVSQKAAPPKVEVRDQFSRRSPRIFASSLMLES